MSDTLNDYLVSHESLLSELAGENKVRQFPLRLPDVPVGRELGQVLLEIPMAFPENASARIRLSSENVLRVPHIDSDGKLCIGDGDPGSLSGASPIERIGQLIDAFFDRFLYPWCAGGLDDDFSAEAQNYWEIHCNRSSSPHDAVTKVYTLGGRHTCPRIYYAKYLAGSRIVILDSDAVPELSNRFISAMGQRQQLRQVLVADIPISYPLTPDTWSRDQASLERLLHMRLGRDVARNFLSVKGHRKRSMHRIVILRAPDCSFGFLLSGGPPTVVHRGHSTRAYYTKKLLPLMVERLDPSWTCGRDQHPEVNLRQQQHVLVIGVGALGSPVIEQLAKAGIGSLTIVDQDILSAANIGRHVLGADAIGRSKATMLARQFAIRWPSCTFTPVPNSIQQWLMKNNLSNVDMVLDLTGEPTVRLSIDVARKQHSCALLIGWMEPYVAAAHACLLPRGYPWIISSVDYLESLQAVTWPDDVVQREPSCSSVFQSYTPAAATHAVALVAEAALDLLDEKIKHPLVRDWVRGQKFLDTHRPGLSLRPWAIDATQFDGVSMERPYE